MDTYTHTNIMDKRNHICTDHKDAESTKLSATIITSDYRHKNGTSHKHMHIQSWPTIYCDILSKVVIDYVHCMYTVQTVCQIMSLNNNTKGGLQSRLQYTEHRDTWPRNYLLMKYISSLTS